MNTYRIGLVIHHTLSFYRDILRGIRDYGRKKDDWSFVPIQPNARSIRSQRCTQCDGLICHASTPGLVDAIVGLSIPWVNVSAVLPRSLAPRIMVDHVAVGALAADYFLNRGYRSFAFVGYRNHLFSSQRELGFRQRIEEAGMGLSHIINEPVSYADPSGLLPPSNSLSRWLSSLPPATGLLTSNDVQGFQVTEVCRELEIDVPGRISVISVDNDDLLCNLSRPALSSVALPTQQIGIEAACLIEQMLNSKPTKSSDKLLGPVGVIERASTSMFAIDDCVVAAALQFIHENVRAQIRVGDVVRRLAVSRRLLERRFRQVLGTTVADAICHRQIETAKQLLAETELTMSQIARAAGYSDGKHFSTSFRRVLGLTPTEYRRRSRYP